LHFDLIKNDKLLLPQNINWIFLFSVILFWFFRTIILSFNFVNCFLIFTEKSSSKLFLNHSSENQSINSDCDTLNRN
jgi:uncharacterized membrane protein